MTTSVTLVRLRFIITHSSPSTLFFTMQASTSKQTTVDNVLEWPDIFALMELHALRIGKQQTDKNRKRLLKALVKSVQEKLSDLSLDEPDHLNKVGRLIQLSLSSAKSAQAVREMVNEINNGRLHRQAPVKTSLKFKRWTFVTVVEVKMKEEIVAKAKILSGCENSDVGSKAYVSNWGRARSSIIAELSEDIVERWTITAEEWNKEGPSPEYQAQYVFPVH
jgi:hypothetical protein